MESVFRYSKDLGLHHTQSGHMTATEEQMEYLLLDCLNHQQTIRLWKQYDNTSYLWGAVESHPDNPTQLIHWCDVHNRPQHS